MTELEDYTAGLEADRDDWRERALRAEEGLLRSRTNLQTLERQTSELRALLGHTRVAVGAAADALATFVGGPNS